MDRQRGQSMEEYLEKPARLKRSLILVAATGVLGFLLLWLWQRGNFDLQLVRDMHPWPLAAAFAMSVASWFVQVHRLSLLSAALDYPVGPLRLFEFYMTGSFLAGITPNSQGGVPVVIYLLRREGMSWGRASAVSITTSATLVFVFVMVVPLLALFGRLNLASDNRILVGAFAAVFTVLYALLFVRPRLVGGWFVSLARWHGWRYAISARKQRAVTVWLRREVRRFARGVNRLMQDQFWAVVQVVLLSFLYWGLYLSIPIALLEALSVSAPWGKVIAAQVVFFLLQPLIPTPGASGGAELGFAALLTSVVPQMALAPLVMFWRLATYYINIVVGGITTFLLLGEHVQPAGE